jgi:hypothetical protein
MKITCPCGSVISDTTDDLPYKAYLRADQDDAEYQGILDRDARAIARAHRGEPSGGVAQEQLERALQELGLSATRLERPIYECQVCGRILVPSRRDARKFVSFLPESSVRGVLMSIDERTGGF